jgi:glycosyltransferase involved in cell wall biosynthesis
VESLVAGENLSFSHQAIKDGNISLNGTEKVLFLAPTGELGGAERCLVDTLWSFRRRWPGLRMVLIAGSAGPLVEASLAAGADEVVILPLPSSTASLGDSAAGGSISKLIGLIVRMILAVPRLTGYLIRLCWEVRQHEPRFVHVLGLKMQLISLWVVPRKVPVVWNVQDYVGSRRLISKLIRWNLRLFGRGRKLAAGCCADDVVRDFESVIPPGSFRSVRTIYNTVDLDRFRPEGERIPLAASPIESVKIGLIATYARWKGHDVFLNALETLKNQPNLPAWHAWIVGGPIYATAGSQWSPDELISMIEAKGLQGSVTLLPFQKDPASVMRSLDVVVHASSNPEPFGRVIAEAQACGRAVAAVGTGGSGEAFKDGRTGLAIRMNDASSMATVLERLVCDERLRHDLGSAGVAWVAAQFDRRHLASHWQTVYEAIE